MDPSTVATILTLFQNHAWVPLASLVIFAIVRLLKSDAVPAPFSRIPPNARPYVALVLGIVSMVLDHVAAGTPWKTAAWGGLVSVALAVLFHQTVIEGVRGGREFAASSGPLSVTPPGSPPTSATKGPA